MRPVWVVSEGIHNATWLSVKDVRIQIHVVYKSSNKEADSGLIDVDTVVPGESTVPFSRELHLSPPKQPWEWHAEAWEAKIVSDL